MPLERFIPFRKRDVITLCENLLAHESESFRTFSTLLVSRIHYKYHEQLEALKNIVLTNNLEIEQLEKIKMYMVKFQLFIIENGNFIMTIGLHLMLTIGFGFLSLSMDVEMGWNDCVVTVDFYLYFWAWISR